MPNFSHKNRKKVIETGCCRPVFLIRRIIPSTILPLDQNFKMLIKFLKYPMISFHVPSLCRKPLLTNHTRGMRGYSIKPFPRTEYKKLTEFLLQHYHTQEVMSKVLGVNIEKEVRSWFGKYIFEHLSLSPEVTAKAVDLSTGQIIGVNFAVVVDPKNSTKPPLMIDFVDQTTQPIMAQVCRFLDEIEEGLEASELLGVKSLALDDEPKCLVHIMMAVDKNYWRQGLAGKLIDKSEELASNIKLCRSGKAICSSEYSAKAFAKMGYQTVREFQYENYKDGKGVKIFGNHLSELGEHKTAKVMIKLLK